MCLVVVKKTKVFLMCHLGSVKFWTSIFLKFNFLNLYLNGLRKKKHFCILSTDLKKINLTKIGFSSI